MTTTKMKFIFGHGGILSQSNFLVWPKQNTQYAQHLDSYSAWVAQ